MSLINILWTITSGRRLHVQQQEFQSVYECIDKVNGMNSNSPSLTHRLKFSVEHHPHCLSSYLFLLQITGFMSRAAIMSFLPLLSRVIPESISKMERGRYYRNRFVAISEVGCICKISSVWHSYQMC